MAKTAAFVGIGPGQPTHKSISLSQRHRVHRCDPSAVMAALSDLQQLPRISTPTEKLT